MFCYNCWYYLTVVTDDPREIQYRVFIQRITSEDQDYDWLELGATRQFQIPIPNTYHFSKFIMDSTDPFEVEVKVSSGTALVKISNNPLSLDSNPIWTLEQQTGTGFIKVQMNDPDFHMGTTYYVSVQNIATFNTFVSLRVTQHRVVNKIANFVPKKF